MRAWMRVVGTADVCESAQYAVLAATRVYCVVLVMTSGGSVQQVLFPQWQSGDAVGLL